MSADGTRLRMLQERSRGPRSVTELAEATATDGTTADNRLPTPEEAELVECYRRGRTACVARPN